MKWSDLTEHQRNAICADLHYDTPEPTGDNGTALVPVFIEFVNPDNGERDRGMLRIATLRVSRFGRVELFTGEDDPQKGAILP